MPEVIAIANENIFPNCPFPRHPGHNVDITWVITT